MCVWLREREIERVCMYVVEREREDWGWGCRLISAFICAGSRTGDLDSKSRWVGG